MQKIFRTQISPSDFRPSINHQDQILLIGSCFSQNIGDKLSKHCFKSCVNPVGIYYDPFSLLKIVKRVLGNQEITKNQFLKSDDLYYHWDLHSSFRDTNLDHIYQKVSAADQLFKDRLVNSKFIFISLGSSVHFRLKSTGAKVANCHKQVPSLFNRVVPYFEETFQTLKDLYLEIKKHNSVANIIITLSPVRHIRHGFEANTIGKSTLLTSIHHLSKETDISYFPSYEIMIDELRDYRFYQNDLIHPNQLAIDFIWDFFSKVYFSKETQKLVQEIKLLKQQIDHVPRHRLSKSHLKFQQNLSLKISTFKKLNPNIKLDPIIINYQS